MINVVSRKSVCPRRLLHTTTHVTKRLIVYLISIYLRCKLSIIYIKQAVSKLDEVKATQALHRETSTHIPRYSVLLSTYIAHYDHINVRVRRSLRQRIQADYCKQLFPAYEKLFTATFD